MVSHYVQSAWADTASEKEGLASPVGHRAKCLTWSAGAPSAYQVWLQYHFMTLYHCRIGKSINDFTRQIKIPIHIMIEIKRDFWRYLVQLPVQAESPRAGLLGTTNRWLLNISKNGYFIVFLGNLLQCSLTLTIKKCFFMVRSLYQRSPLTLLFFLIKTVSQESHWEFWWKNKRLKALLPSLGN